jgi:hypothetical protein
MANSRWINDNLGTYFAGCVCHFPEAARENIETELVQQPSKKNLDRIAPRPPTSILAALPYTN